MQRARLCVSVSTELLIQWLYSMRGLDDNALHLYSTAFSRNAVDSDVLLSLTEKDLERVIENTQKHLFAPPHTSREKQVEAVALWRLMPGEGPGEGLGDEGMEILINIYKPSHGKADGKEKGVKDTDWGKLATDSVSVLAEEEVKEWKAKHKALLNGQVSAILKLAQMTAAPDIDTLLPLIWNVQPRDAHSRLTQAHITKILLGARFTFSQVATILGVAIQIVEELNAAEEGSAADGENVDFIAFAAGFKNLVDASVEEFTRLGGEGIYISPISPTLSYYMIYVYTNTK